MWILGLYIICITHLVGSENLKMVSTKSVFAETADLSREICVVAFSHDTANDAAIKKKVGQYSFHSRMHFD